jgi:serine/threonine-protein kinase
MSIDLRNDRLLLPADLVALVDETCDDFENALKGEQRPSIKPFLARVPEQGRAVLFRELLGLDLDYRKLRGEQPTPEDYLAHFPEYTEQVQAAFAGGSPARVPATRTADARSRNQPREKGPEELPAIPGYEVLGVLGRGGMGVVYKARHLQSDRLVALKIIRMGLGQDSAALARFRKEAEVIARLRHKNIVRVHALGAHKGQPYLILEYIEQGSLDRMLGKKPLPARKAALLALKLARAVEYSHQHGIIHRDLKPANVLMTEEGEPKITDFGLARDMDATRLTQSGDIIGTPCYMAPEQAAGDVKRIGPATDVYALGAILYEMLTGRPPFKGGNVLEILAKVGTQQPLPPRALNPAGPVALEAICLTCLKKVRSERYARAADLAADLVNFLKSRPIKGTGRSEKPPFAVPAGGPGRTLRNLVLTPRGALSVCLLLLWSFSLYQGLRGNPRAAIGLAAGLLAAPLVAYMVAQARLVPLAAGGLAGLVATLIGSLTIFSSLGGRQVGSGLVLFLASDGLPLLYLGALVGGLSAGVFFAVPWPRSGILAALLALLVGGGLLGSNEAGVLVLFTLVAVWIAGVGRAVAAWWGSNISAAIFAAFGGLCTAWLVFPIAMTLQLFGFRIDPRFLGWFALVLAVVGSIQRAVGAAWQENHIRTFLRERGLPVPGQDGAVSPPLPSTQPYTPQVKLCEPGRQSTCRPADRKGCRNNGR